MVMVAACLSTAALAPVAAAASPSAARPGTPAKALTTQTRTPSTVIVTSTANPATVGSVVSYLATVASTGPAPARIPTGTVDFYSDGVSLGSAALSSAGVATYSSSTDLVGTFHITAHYEGDGLSTGSYSDPLPQVMNGIPTTTALILEGGAIRIQDSTLYAAVSSTTHVDGVGATGQVDFYFDGAPFGGGFAYSSGLAMLLDRTLPLGTHTVQAFYRGNSQYVASTSTKRTLVVVPDQATTSLTLTPSTGSAKHGRQVVFTAGITTTGIAPVTTGQIRFLVGGIQVQAPQDVSADGTVTFSTRALPTGRVTVAAEYSGTADFAASTSTLDYTVGKESTTTTLKLPAPSTTSGAPGPLTASVRGEHGAVPAGAVTFTVDGTAGKPVQLDAGGSAALSLVGLTAGIHQVTAAYSGTIDYTTSSAQTAVTI